MSTLTLVLLAATLFPGGQVVLSGAGRTPVIAEAQPIEPKPPLPEPPRPLPPPVHRVPPEPPPPERPNPVRAHLTGEHTVR